LLLTQKPYEKLLYICSCLPNRWWYRQRLIESLFSQQPKGVHHALALNVDEAPWFDGIRLQLESNWCASRYFAFHITTFLNRYHLLSHLTLWGWEKSFGKCNPCVIFYYVTSGSSLPKDLNFTDLFRASLSKKTARIRISPCCYNANAKHENELSKNSSL